MCQFVHSFITTFAINIFQGYVFTYVLLNINEYLFIYFPQYIYSTFYSIIQLHILNSVMSLLLSWYRQIIKIKENCKRLIRNHTFTRVMHFQDEYSQSVQNIRYGKLPRELTSKTRKRNPNSSSKDKTRPEHKLIQSNSQVCCT